MDLIRRRAFVPTMCAPSVGRKQWHRAAATTALAAFMLTSNVRLEHAVLPAQATEIVQHGPAYNNGEQALAYEVWDVLNKYYYDPMFHGVDWAQELQHLRQIDLKNRSATYAALRKAIVKLRDPYTRLLDSQQMTMLRKYDVTGVGLLLIEDGSGDLMVATNPAHDSAAGRVGVKRGDIVEEVDGRSVRGVGAFTVAEWMQGAENSSMRVKFRDKGEVTLVRRFSSEGSMSSVEKAIVVGPGQASDNQQRKEDRMGYIRLSGFTASSRNDIAKALRDVRAHGADWIVLDLRGNGGGVFEGALEIAGLFEGDGIPVVQVQGRQETAPAMGDAASSQATTTTKTTANGGLREIFASRVVDATATDVWDDVDVAILIDGRSASSSEVLAGGLRDSCKAALVGQRSYGKGLIQGVFGLSDGGGVILTVAEYRTPSGKRIDGIGLQTDLALKVHGIDRFLKVFGIERIAEDSFVLSHDDIRDVLNMCRSDLTNNGVISNIHR